MRLLVLNYEFPPLGGGAGNATAEFVRALEHEPDLEVVVVTSSIGELRVDRHTFTSNSTIHYLPIGKQDTSIHYQTNRELATYVFACYRYLNRLLATESFDRCHAVMTVPAGINAWLIRKRVPYLVSLQGSDVPGYSERFGLLYKFLTPIIHRIWRDASAVVANSEGLRRVALESAPRQVVGVIPNGVDIEHFSPGPEGGSDDGEPTSVVCVGRLIERKGVWELVRAIARVAEKLPRVRLHLIGSGNLERPLERWIDEQGLGDRVTLHGSVPHEDLPDYLRRSDLFVLPSHAEGMSNALLEAMSCGLPVAVTDTGGTRELLQGNGLIVPKKDPAALAETLTHMLADGRRLAEWGRASREVALGLSWRSMTQQYLELHGRATRKTEQVAV